MLSSAVYIINDIHDIDRDRAHPVKRNRPLPSGKLSMSLAIELASLFLFISLSSSLILGDLFLVVCLAYLGQSLLYTFWLKEIAIVDVAVVSTGFVWRAIAGTTAISVKASPWLIICSFLLALFLALNKRESELNTVKHAQEFRNTLGSYSKQLLDTFLSITTASLLVAYMLYTFESGHIYMMITIPFAFIGIFRYIQLAQETENNNNGATFIFRDRLTQLNLLLWALMSTASLYGIVDLIVKFLTI
jgi:4-hydroxybenzoate polyprenyltransferase